MKRIAVYCGSNKGVRPEYAAAARELGTLLAREKIDLVYGGGMAEWAAQGRPTETGARNSGVLKTPSPP